jgi:hypothetical protein
LSQLEPIAVVAKALGGALARELELQVGSEVVARVAAGPGPDGRGVLSLAGFLHTARLPAGVREGEKLRLRVAGADGGALLLRLAGDDGGSSAGASAARVAGALAVRGDGDLVRVGLELAGAAGALALPDGSSARVSLDAGSSRRAAGRDAPAEARVVLDAPALGPIEVRLRLDAADVSVVVRVEPGRAQDLAQRGAAELTAALERATARPAVVSVAARAAEDMRPAPPRPTDVFDAYA